MSPDKNGTPVILAGASCRALAQSFVRAGYLPICFDLFADADLSAFAPVKAIDLPEWPLAILPHLKPFKGIPFVFTGGLENHPAFLDEITKSHPFFGNIPTVYQSLRDPFFLSRRLKSLGIGFPDVISAGEEIPGDKEWLLKPIGGSGGIGIRPYQKASGIPEENSKWPPGYYAQKFIPGEDISISFLLTQIGPLLLMISRGIPIRDQLDAPGMSYVGNHLEENKLAGNLGKSISPVLMQTLGTFLWNEGLRGLVGVDGRIDDLGQFFVLEINPRYTASMELGEMSRGTSFAKLHAECFEKSPNSNDPTDPFPISGYVPTPDDYPRTKAILYARSEIWLPTDIPWPTKFKFLEEKHKIGLCDLPTPGTFVAKGAPILTIIEKGTQWADLKDRFGPILEDLRNQLEHT